MPTALQASISSVPAGAEIDLPSTVMVTLFTSDIRISSRQNRQFLHAALWLKRTGPSFQVGFELVAPLVHNRYGWDCSRVTQRAKCSSQHVLRQVLDVVYVFFQTAAVVESRKRLLEPVCTFATGNAPAAALVLIELHDAQSKFHHARLIVHDHYASRAQELAALAERIKVHIHLLGFGRGEHEGGRAAGNNCFQFASVGNPASDVIDHLLK